MPAVFDRLFTRRRRPLPVLVARARVHLVGRREAGTRLIPRPFWQQNEFRSSFLACVGRKMGFGVVKTSHKALCPLSRGPKAAQVRILTPISVVFTTEIGSLPRGDFLLL